MPGLPRPWLVACVLGAALPAFGQEAALNVPVPTLNCAGTEPPWSLSLSPDGSTLRFGPEQAFDIPQSVAALGREWPRAYTLISPDFRATAIVVLSDQTCLGTPDRAVHVLTQSGTSPVMLTGCCTNPQ